MSFQIANLAIPTDSRTFQWCVRAHLTAPRQGAAGAAGIFRTLGKSNAERSACTDGIYVARFRNPTKVPPSKNFRVVTDSKAAVGEFNWGRASGLGELTKALCLSPRRDSKCRVRVSFCREGEFVEIVGNVQLITGFPFSVVPGPTATRAGRWSKTWRNPPARCG